MIVIDNSYQIGGKVYRRTVSDENRMIRKVGADEIYSEAVDVLTSQWKPTCPLRLRHKTHRLSRHSDGCTYESNNNMEVQIMTRQDFIKTHEAEICKLSNLLREQDVDLGIAQSIFVNAAMLGHIPDGDEPQVRAALATLGGADYWAALAKEYAGAEG